MIICKESHSSYFYCATKSQIFCQRHINNSSGASYTNANKQMSWHNLTDMSEPNDVSVMNTVLLHS